MPAILNRHQVGKMNLIQRYKAMKTFKFLYIVPTLAILTCCDSVPNLIPEPEQDPALDERSVEVVVSKLLTNSEPWQSGDEITLFDSEGNRVGNLAYSYSVDDEGISAVFTNASTGTGLNQGDVYTVVYPGTEKPSLDEAAAVNLSGQVQSGDSDDHIVDRNIYTGSFHYEPESTDAISIESRISCVKVMFVSEHIPAKVDVVIDGTSYSLAMKDVAAIDVYTAYIAVSPVQSEQGDINITVTDAESEICVNFGEKYENGIKAGEIITVSSPLPEVQLSLKVSASGLKINDEFTLGGVWSDGERISVYSTADGKKAGDFVYNGAPAESAVFYPVDPAIELTEGEIYTVVYPSSESGTIPSLDVADLMTQTQAGNSPLHLDNTVMMSGEFVYERSTYSDPKDNASTLRHLLSYVTYTFESDDIPSSVTMIDGETSYVVNLLEVIPEGTQYDVYFAVVPLEQKVNRDITFNVVTSGGELSYTETTDNAFEAGNVSAYTCIRSNIEIGTPEELIAFAGLVNAGTADADAVLTANIDMKGFNLPPIGSKDIKYSGSFDGNGYTISNLSISASNTDYVGLFGHIEGAAIENLTLRNINVSGSSYVGGIVGYAGGGSLISNCHVNDGSVVCVTEQAAASGIGGVAGYITNTVIRFCSNTNVAVSSPVDNSGIGSVGGVVGISHSKGNVIACWNTGDITAGYNAGGIVGLVYEFEKQASRHKIIGCYNTGKVTSSDAVGGIVARIGMTKAPTVLVTSCYNTGTVDYSYNTADSNKGLIYGLWVNRGNFQVSDSYSVANAHMNENQDGELLPGISDLNEKVSSMNSAMSTAKAELGTPNYEYVAGNGDTPPTLTVK